MKNNYLYCIISLLIFSCHSEKKQQEEKNVVVTKFEKVYFKQNIDSILKQNHFNGAVYIVENQEKLYEQENGFSNFKTQSKIDSTTVFAIGSLSKQITGVLVLLQYEQGKLKLEDKASKYLESFNTPEYKNITIHQLLNHTSGLNTLGGKLLFKSGTDFFYSNDGYNSLGKIIEKTSGKSYDENAQELFAKVGMNNSSTASIYQGKNFAGAYVGNYIKPQAIENMPKRLASQSVGTPAGGVLSTIQDLVKWNTALYEGNLLKPETLKKFTAQSAERDHPLFGKVGYCYGIMMNLGKPKHYFHTGYVKGSPSLNIYYPETKTSVIILSNIADDAQGFETIFKTHLQIKKVIDNIENTVVIMKKDIMVN